MRPYRGWIETKGTGKDACGVGIVQTPYSKLMTAYMDHPQSNNTAFMCGTYNFPVRGSKPQTHSLCSSPWPLMKAAASCRTKC